MYFNHIKYILIDLKLFKIGVLLNKTLKYLIICVGSILGHDSGHLYLPWRAGVFRLVKAMASRLGKS